MIYWILAIGFIGSIGTYAAPALRTPKIAAIISLHLTARIATKLFFPIPAETSFDAIRSDNSSSCWKLTFSVSEVSATLFGCSLT